MSLLVLVVACESSPPVSPTVASEAARMADGESWIVEGDQVAAYLWRVASAGDVNGDGYDDVLAGSSAYDGTATDDGMAALYLGSATGPSATASWVGRGGQANAQYASRFESAGDVNGDGYDDVVVAAPWFDAGLQDEGKVFVYLGSAAGLSAQPAWTGEGNQAGVTYGSAVAGVGDVNGDGYDDLVVGERNFSNGQAWEGRALLYLGSAAGLSAAPVWAREGGHVNDSFGDQVAAAGDVNGDGFADVLVAASLSSNGGYFQNGRVELYLGGAVGLGAAPAWSRTGGGSSVAFGEALSSGDVDDDGYSDLLVTQGFGSSQALAFLGSPTGPAAAPAWTVRGSSLSILQVAVGDLDGDGRHDLVVGDAADTVRLAGDGSVSIYLGSAGPLPGTAVLRFGSDQAGAGFGSDVALADLDGDGDDDLLVGADTYDAGEVDEGAVFGFLDPLADGDADGVPDLGDACPAMADPAQLDTDADGIGNACDDPTFAVTGTPTVGRPLTLRAAGLAPGERAQFAVAPGAGSVGPCPAALGGLCLDLGPAAIGLGSAVADATGSATLTLLVPPTLVPDGTYVLQAAVPRGVGGADAVKSNVVTLDGTVLDWDGDGLTDATETALGTDPRLDDTDGDGLTDAEELVAPFDPLDPDGDGDGVLDGADVCLVGDDAADADGDGVADACDDCALDADPAQADADADGLGDACEGAVLLAAGTLDARASGANLGAALAAADVDGDGFTDLVAGAPRGSTGLATEGVVVLYRGSAAGLGAPVVVATGQQAGAQLGLSLAAAGDLDGDGYEDVLAGAPLWDGTYADSGEVRVFAGSAAGLGAAPAWVLDGEGEFGLSVVGAGDVDGDGYDDLAVGSPNLYVGAAWAGQVALYAGSASGPGAVPSWTASGTTASYLGEALAAGDLDGDGFSDLAVGAWGFEGGPSYAGAAYVYRGSPAGLDADPSWSRVGAAANDDFGLALGSADTNGDGYVDLVVGAFGVAAGQTQGAGAAYVYLGTAAGPERDAAWSGAGDGAYASFGQRVGSAGDVDGDGFEDLVVTAPGHDSATEQNSGEAELFLGTPSGPAAAPAWLDESMQFYGQLGSAVASGDLDGDGRSDVFVGAAYEDVGQHDTGRVHVYLGQAP